MTKDQDDSTYDSVLCFTHSKGTLKSVNFSFFRVQFPLEMASVMLERVLHRIESNGMRFEAFEFRLQGDIVSLSFEQQTTDLPVLVFQLTNTCHQSIVLLIDQSVFSFEMILMPKEIFQLPVRLFELFDGMQKDVTLFIEPVGFERQRSIVLDANDRLHFIGLFDVRTSLSRVSMSLTEESCLVI